MGRVTKAVKNAAKKVSGKAAPKPRQTVKKEPVDRSFTATVLRQYDRGESFAALAEKHEVSVEKIQAIVEADQAKNVQE